MAAQIEVLILLILYMACTSIASETTSSTTNIATFAFTEDSVEQFRFQLRNAIDKEYLLGNVKIRFSQYPNIDVLPVFRLEVTERARHLRLREVFPAYQFILVDLTGGYFVQELVLDPVNVSKPMHYHHQCTLNSSPQQLVANFRNTNDLMVWKDIVQCLNNVIKNVTGQSDQTSGDIMEDTKLANTSDIPVCIYNWSHKKQTKSVISFFIEPILNFNSYGFREIVCWDDGTTIYSNSYLSGYLGQWHMSISVVAMILSLFCPLLLFMCRRTDTHISDKEMKENVGENATSETGTIHNSGTIPQTNADYDYTSISRDEYQRMSYDTEPLPFGASYLLLHWDRPIYKYRSGEPWLTIFPFLNIRLLILSFLLQIDPNLIRLLAPDFEDTVEYNPVTIYIVSSVITYVSLICTYLIIFTDIKNTWFAKRDTALVVRIKGKYKKLWQPKVPQELDYSENVGMFLQIMRHRVYVLSKKNFWKFLRESPCVCVPKFIAFVINAMPLIGYFQLAVLVGNNKRKKSIRSSIKNFFCQICRFFMVLFSLKVMIIINFYIVCFIYTIIFLFAFTKEIGPTFSFVMAILVIVVKPCNNFFNIYCKLFRSVMRVTKMVQEHIHTIDQNSNSLTSLKLVNRGEGYVKLLDKVKENLKDETTNDKHDDKLTSLIQYTKDGKPTIESKLFWAMVVKHQPICWTIVVHVIITYFIPIVSLYVLVSAYFLGVDISFADLAEQADTSAVLVLAAMFTLVWLLFLSQEQRNCWDESLIPQYAYDVLYYALNGSVPTDVEESSDEGNGTLQILDL